MNQHVKGALALVLVTALSFGVILGTRALTSEPESSVQEGTPAQQSETIDVSGFEGLRGAERLLNGDGSTAGYAVTAAVRGYQSEIVTEVRFDSTGATVTGVRVLEQGETEQVGSKVTEGAFLDQFAGVSAPVALSGAVDTEQDFGELADGEYEATGAESDGYTPTLRMTVEGGRITEVYWDEIGADGKGKRELSESGEYTMTEDGPIWAEQADALGDALIESQSLSAFPTDEAGKTDAVSGVSISIGGFLSLAADCMEQASGGGQQAPEGTQIDAVSGATYSSTAVVEGVNLAYGFVQSIAG